MTKWKFLKLVILFGILFVSFQCGYVDRAWAANSGVYLEDVLHNSHFSLYKDLKDPNITADIISGNHFDLRVYPTVKSIDADYVKDGRITSSTKNMIIRTAGHAGIEFYDNDHKNFQGNIDKFRIVLMTAKNSSGNRSSIDIISTSAPIEHGDPTTVQLYRTLKLPVDFSKLKDFLPVYIGFQLTTSKKPNEWITYRMGTFMADELQKELTITAGPTPDNLTVVGMGTPDSTIASDVNDQTATVGSDGKYKISVAYGLEAALRKNRGITIFETNEFGDSASVSQKQLTMPIAEENSTFQIEDSLSYEKGTTDDQVIDDLRKRLKIKIASDDLSFNEDVRYGSTQKNLADLINHQQVGTTVEIPIYATKPGYIRSNNVVVKVTKNTSNVIFTNNKAYLDFARRPIPLRPESIWSADVWKLSVIDDRVKERTKWSLTAKATETVQDTKTPKIDHVNDLSNYLWYQPSKGQAQQLNQGVTILTSEMAPVSGQPNLFEHEFNGKEENGIFVKATPDMAIGAYSATITWTLQLAPTS